MQQSDNSKSAAMVSPLFSKDWELSLQDFAILEQHIFSKLKVACKKVVSLLISPESRIKLAPHTFTTYRFKISDFKKQDQAEVVGLLQYKVLPFVSQKLLQNPQMIYEIEITIGQKSPNFYHLWLTVQTETQVKNQKKIKILDVQNIKNAKLNEKKKEEERILAMADRARKRAVTEVLNKCERSIYTAGNLRDFKSVA